MNDRFMAALLALFVRAYHSDGNGVKIFDDYAAKSLLSAEECRQIPGYLLAGMNAVNKHSGLSSDEALKKLVNRYFAPSILAISVFCEASLERAVKIGAEQYINIGSGYDTFFCRQPLWASGIEIFELEDYRIIYDKRKRISAAGLTVPNNVYFIGAEENMSDCPRFLSSNLAFSARKRSFVCVPYMTTAFSRENFQKLLLNMRDFLAHGSTVLFDYPNEFVPGGYTYDELEIMLSKYGLNIYEHLTRPDIMGEYFSDYNNENPDEPISAPANMNYCLAVVQ